MGAECGYRRCERARPRAEAGDGGTHPDTRALLSHSQIPDIVFVVMVGGGIK